MLTVSPHNQQDSLSGHHRCLHKMSPKRWTDRLSKGVTSNYCCFLSAFSSYQLYALFPDLGKQCGQYEVITAQKNDVENSKRKSQVVINHSVHRSCGVRDFTWSCFDLLTSPGVFIVKQGWVNSFLTSATARAATFFSSIFIALFFFYVNASETHICLDIESSPQWSLLG